MIISMIHKTIKPPETIKITAKIIPIRLPFPKLLNNLIRLPYKPYKITKINLMIHGNDSIAFASCVKELVFFAILLFSSPLLNNNKKLNKLQLYFLMNLIAYSLQVATKGIT